MAITKAKAEKVGQILSRESNTKKMSPAEVVSMHLDKILAMRANGHSFSDIYATVSKEVNLGITESSFRQYVTDAKRARKGERA